MGTSAAKRAVFDAIHHSSLGFPRLVGKTADDMHVQVTIGVPKPEAVDKKAVLETLPHGGGHINVVQGGLQVLNEKGDDGWLIANAILVVSMLHDLVVGPGASRFSTGTPEANRARRQAAWLGRLAAVIGIVIGAIESGMARLRLVKEKCNQCPLKFCALAFVNREARACYFNTKIKINDIVFLNQFPVGQSIGTKRRRGPMLMGVDIFFRSQSCRDFFGRNIRNSV